jgi:hypothetical protein
MNHPSLKAEWTEDFLRITAVFELPGGRSCKIGFVQGVVKSPAFGLLSDIKVDDQIEVRTGLFNLRKEAMSARDKGIGSELLAWFEHEMGTHGVQEIHGNLVPETPDKLEWLIEWYRKRGYQFHPGETAGSWSPPKTAGVVSKRIPIRSPYESRALGKVILDGGPGEP